VNAFRMATGFLALLPILPVPLLPLLVLQTLGLGGFLLSVASSGGLCRTLLLLQTLNNDSTADPPHSAQNFLPGIPSVPHFEQRILCS
jgi:hypothetical protein